MPPLTESSPPSTSSARKPSYTQDANLHAVAHLYASDRNSLFIIPNLLGVGDKFTRMASLSHTVIFHVGVDQLLVPDEPVDKPPNAAPTQRSASGPSEKSKERKWFMQESWTTRATGGRGLHTSRLWDPATGVHLATTIQDGLIRLKSDARL
jgi:acyl-CoA thioesterase